MDAGKIEKAISSEGDGEYNPDPVEAEEIDLDTGTRIILHKTKRQLQVK